METELHRAEKINHPLELFVCEKCYLVQLDEFETASTIFSSNYAYFSSYSESWLPQHCKTYVNMMISRLSLTNPLFVVEIASNDGYLLQYFKDYDLPILGIEPSSNTAQVALKRGISD